MQVDQALVAAFLLADDRRAFEQHCGAIRHGARATRRLVNGDHGWADLAQETFLLAWRKLDQFRARLALFHLALSHAYSCFLQARRRRLPATGDMDADASVLRPVPCDTVEMRLDVDRAMRCLSEPEQIVLTHVVQLGLSHDEAAYVLAMPLGTVKSHANRGKAKLRALLADWQSVSQEEQGK